MSAYIGRFVFNGLAHPKYAIIRGIGVKCDLSEVIETGFGDGHPPPNLRYRRENRRFSLLSFIQGFVCSLPDSVLLVAFAVGSGGGVGAFPEEVREVPGGVEAEGFGYFRNRHVGRAQEVLCSGKEDFKLVLVGRSSGLFSEDIPERPVRKA